MIIPPAIVTLLAVPPAAYDYEPVESYQIQMVTPDEISAWCGELEGQVQFACWNEWSGAIYIRNDLSPEAFRYVLRHEKAHVNGWIH